MNVSISSGHGLHVSGAIGLINESIENRRVTTRVSEILRSAKIQVNEIHDNVSRNAKDNVNWLIREHNRTTRDLDVQIHFNSTSSGAVEDRAIGVEALYRTGNAETRTIAGRVARAIAESSGLLLRHQWRDVAGTVPVTGIGFLNNTDRPAVLIEVCFVVSRVDVRIYQEHFENICQAIAASVVDRVLVDVPPPIEVEPPVFAPGHEPSEWAENAWRWGIQNGITDGTNPKIASTREQVVQLIKNYHETML